VFSQVVMCQLLYCPLSLDCGGYCCYCWFVIEKTILNHHNQFFTTMNTTILLNNPIVEKYNELMEQVANNEAIQQILYTIATVVGFIVGVTVWVTNRVSDWYNNGGRETLLRYTQRVLLFVSSTTERAYYWVCDVTESELAH